MALHSRSAVYRHLTDRRRCIDRHCTTWREVSVGRRHSDFRSFPEAFFVYKKVCNLGINVDRLCM